MAEELQHVEPIRDSAWLTAEVVDAIGGLIDQGVISPGRYIRDDRLAVRTISLVFLPRS